MSNNINNKENPNKDDVDRFVSSTGDFARLPDRDGGTLTYQFSLDKSKRKLVDREFTDKSTGQVTVSQKVEYMVTNPEDPDSGEKRLDTPKTLAAQIERYIQRGKSKLEIVRTGVGPSTRYNAYSVD